MISIFCGQDNTCQGVVFVCLPDNADNARLGLVSVFKKTFFFVAKIKLYKQLQIISRAFLNLKLSLHGRRKMHFFAIRCDFMIANQSFRTLIFEGSRGEFVEHLSLT